jgi:hypothetical protein
MLYRGDNEAVAARRASEAAGVLYRTPPVFFTAVTHRVMFDWFDVYTVDHYNTSNKRTN